MPSPRRSFWRRNRWLLWLAGALVVALIAVSITLAVAARHVEPFLRAQIVSSLQQRFHTRVELDQFHVSVHHGVEARWGIWATGQGLRIWPPNQTGGDRPLEISVQSLPLIKLDEFAFHVPLRFKTATFVHISEVQLKGLDIHVPPRSERNKETGLRSAIDTETNGTSQPAPSQNSYGGVHLNVQVDRVDCDQAQLILETDKPNKLPLGFSISHLRLTHLSSGKPMNFDADLTNPKPQGDIHASGAFGPWDTSDPGESPLTGNYRFQHADLSAFKGISGMLASTGTYQGTLRALAVDGEADVPDFRLTQFGAAMHLHTQFYAHVDGTDGDTQLDHVNAILGSSHFTTQGHVVRIKQPVGSAGPLPANPVAQAALTEGGHVIDMKVDIPHGTIEDFLRLATHTGTPLLTGFVQTHATLHIPPGDQPIHQRIKLDGSFKLDQAHFTDDKIQKHIVDLSLRGQGLPGNVKSADPNSIASTMQGDFHMASGVITLPDLQYQVPGADIKLKGTYNLDGDLNFDGTAAMQATVSQMVGGWKGFLLKPADRFFKKQGAGTLVPIHVRGTREHPDFGVDLNRLKSTSPETPGQK